MITCTRRLEFDYGHRVYKHESKCAHVHGHRGVVEVMALAPELDSLGRIIDFSVLKQLVGGWIDEHWDHNTLVFHKDETLLAALRATEGNKAPFVCEFNPTAENMAAYLLNVVCPQVLKDTGVQVVRVTLWETPNGRADATVGGL